MVDEGRASRLLRGIAERIDRLAAAAENPDLGTGSLWLEGVKYLFITAIEGCVDVAHHIGSSESWRAPDTNGEAIRLLGEHGVIEPDVAVSVARAVGFRNVLVHQYAQVDNEIVTDSLQQLDLLRSFVSQVSAWILNQSKKA